MATENSEMEVDGIENDSKYKVLFCTGFFIKKNEFPFFSTLHFDEIFML